MKNFIIILLGISLFAFGGCRAGGKNSLLEIPVSPADADSAEPSIAADSEGNLYVLYVAHSAGRTGDVFLQKFDHAANPSGEKVRVNPEAGQATAWRGDQPTIKIGGDNAIYVSWTARVAGEKGAATDLYLSVSNDGGKSFQAPVRINDDKIPASHGMHALAVDQNGRIYAAWLDERYLKAAESQTAKPAPSMQTNGNSAAPHEQETEPNSEVYFAVSVDRGKSFSANKKIAGNICPCCKISMATAPDGRIYISWRQVLDGDFRHFAVTSSIDGGDSFSPLTIVSDDRWQIAACPVSGSSLAVDENNALKIVWFTGGAAGVPGIYQAESKDGGKSFAPRRLVTDKTTDATPVLAQDQNGNSRIVFAGSDQNTYFLAAENGAFVEQNQIGDADQPGAVLARGRLFAVFVRKTEKARKVYLAKQN